MRKVVGRVVAGLVLAALVWPVTGAAGQPPVFAGQAPVLDLRAGRIDLAKIAGEAGARPLRSGEKGLYVIQFNDVITEDSRKLMALNGAEVDSYLPDFAFLVRMTPEAARTMAQDDSVHAVKRFQPAWKLNPGQALTGEADVRIHAFPGAENEVARMVKGAGAASVRVSGRAVIARLDRKLLQQLVASEAVTFVEEVRPFRLNNDVAAGLTGVSGAGGAWSAGLTGTGQVVGIADTGLDTGSLETLHPDFRNRLQVTPIALGRPGDWSDTDGHGTHTAGSIAGDGTANGSVRGMAPDAKLVFQSVLDSNGGLGGIPSDLTALFGQAAGYGARIHSDSWGIPYEYGGWTYDSNAQQVDQYTWNNKEFTVLFAAGNGGQHWSGNPIYNSVTTPGTAKNAITVGASENNRPDRGAYADDPNTVASFSSRGNTPDGRLKPDVVAPGTWILSTRSSLAPDYAYWGTYDSRYAFDSGTSMATPLTAGAAALVRQYFMDLQGVTPAASLIKATLINGAHDLGYGWKSTDQGWGRIDLANSLGGQGALGRWFENETVALATNQAKTYFFSAAAGSPLKFSLVWTDYPGALQAGRELVNDLDLEVTGPDGRQYKGNCFASNTASADCTGFDRVNNVENVYFAAPMAGIYSVRVSGYNVPNGPQPYAVAVSGAGLQASAPDTVAPVVAITAPAQGATVANTVTVAANASDDVGVVRAEFYLDGVLKSTAAAAPYTWAWDTQTTANGLHTVTVKAYDAGSNMGSADVQVTVANATNTLIETDTFTDSLGYTGSSRNFYIDVTAPGPVSLGLSWPTAPANLDIYLYDPAGRQVAAALTSANPESLSYNATVTGRYRVRVVSAAGGSAFTLTAGHPIDATMTATYSQSGTLAQGAMVQYTLTVGAAGSIDLSVAFPAGTDFDLYLLNSAGTTVASAVSATLNPQTISYAVNGPGTYTVRVKSYRGTGSFTVTGHYPR